MGRQSTALKAQETERLEIIAGQPFPETKSAAKDQSKALDILTTPAKPHKEDGLSTGTNGDTITLDPTQEKAWVNYQQACDEVNEAERKKIIAGNRIRRIMGFARYGICPTLGVRIDRSLQYRPEVQMAATEFKKLTASKLKVKK